MIFCSTVVIISDTHCTEKDQRSLIKGSLDHDLIQLWWEGGNLKKMRAEAAIGRCRHQVLLPNVLNLALIALCYIGVAFEITVFGANQGSRGRET